MYAKPETKNVNTNDWYAFWDGDTHESFQEFMESGRPLDEKWAALFKGVSH